MLPGRTGVMAGDLWIRRYAAKSSLPFHKGRRKFLQSSQIPYIIGMNASLPAIVVEGISRYQQSKNTQVRSAKTPLTREQRISRLLNRYASAKLTWQATYQWKMWSKEREAMLAEALMLIDSTFTLDHVDCVWENYLPEDELDRRTVAQYVTWTNNPCRPWNSGDSEHEENFIVFLMSYLDEKPCYQIMYDWS